MKEIQLTPHQLEQVHAATCGAIGVLTGAPGCGKTTVLAWLVKQIVASRGHSKVSVCAPTGKAAVRVTESLLDYGIEIQATTIHSLLGVLSAEGGGWHFEHGVHQKLEREFIFVDECSFLDTSLMCSLLAARAAGTHMLFVGDPHQLPPVGHGAPFRDMIAAGVPSGHLTEIHRNSGRIVKTCSEIRESPHRFRVSPSLDLDSGENLVVAPAQGTEQQVEELRRQIGDAGLDPVRDVQIIVPLNESGELSRKAINRELQGFLNPSGEQIKGAPFRVADKVVCLKNGLVPAAPEPGKRKILDDRVYIANGEQGRVAKVEATRSFVDIESPSRRVVIPHFHRKKDDEDGDVGKCDWELAYAISCHKSQGSSWPVVIVMADTSGGARWICNREWVTTAISRAERCCIIVGQQSTMQGFCRKSGLWTRKTFLVEKIQELEGKEAGQ